MVLLAAAVCTKLGKVLVSRQFVEMTKSRIEGLLAAFPKLLTGDKQHTFVETDAVRYVYQPLDQLYMVLITTKIPEYCKSLSEADVLDNAFSLIFAFDEVISLGYCENLTLPQVRAYLEMDSHDEKVFQAVRQTQEREAKQKSRDKAKEIQRLRVEQMKFGPKSTGFMNNVSSPIIINEIEKPSAEIKFGYNSPSQSSVKINAMKLTTKNANADIFMDQIKSEGEQISSVKKATNGPNVNFTTETSPIEEKVTLSMGRDGGLHNLEVAGLLTLHIRNEQYGCIRVHMDIPEQHGVQLQTHPNIDKELFRSSNQIGLKNSTKPFPFHTDVGVLKYRFQAQDERYIPLSINCWPEENGQGICDVNIEYNLEHTSQELQDVIINIPFPSGVTIPVIKECGGEYICERNHLLWKLPIIDASFKSSSMEFSCKGLPEDFFPVHVSFTYTQPFVEAQIQDVSFIDRNDPVKFSVETLCYTEKYEIL